MRQTRNYTKLLNTALLSQGRLNKLNKPARLTPPIW